METMGEFYKSIKEAIKEKSDKNKNKYVPLLLEKGAIFKSDGVYELQINNKIYFCYPRKGYAMNKFNNKEKVSLYKLLGII